MVPAAVAARASGVLTAAVACPTESMVVTEAPAERRVATRSVPLSALPTTTVVASWASPVKTPVQALGSCPEVGVAPAEPLAPAPRGPTTATMLAGPEGLASTVTSGVSEAVSRSMSVIALESDAVRALPRP